MNTPSFTIINLQQGTQAWLDWRNQGIGASDAPTIMGENPWKSADQLLKERCGGKSCRKNAAMARGQMLEPEARRMYEERFHIKVSPACVQSVTHEWLRASLDGLAINNNIVVEIKCGEKTYRDSSKTRTVPSYYFGQLQHILAVTNFAFIDYWCYQLGQPIIHSRILRDDRYIAKLIETESMFRKKITHQVVNGSKDECNEDFTLHNNTLGLRHGALSLFVQTANRFKCDIEVRKANTRWKVNGKSIMDMGVIFIGDDFRTLISVRTQGLDADIAMTAITKLFETNFGDQKAPPISSQNERTDPERKNLSCPFCKNEYHFLNSSIDSSTQVVCGKCFKSLEINVRGGVAGVSISPQTLNSSTGNSPSNPLASSAVAAHKKQPQAISPKKDSAKEYVSGVIMILALFGISKIIGPPQHGTSNRNPSIYQPAQPQAENLYFFKNGDNKSKVYEIQGAPERSENISGETWFFYGNSYVQFDVYDRVKHAYGGDLRYIK